MKPFQIGRVSAFSEPIGIPNFDKFWKKVSRVRRISTSTFGLLLCILSESSIELPSCKRWEFDVENQSERPRKFVDHPMGFLHRTVHVYPKKFTILQLGKLCKGQAPWAPVQGATASIGVAGRCAGDGHCWATALIFLWGIAGHFFGIKNLGIMSDHVGKYLFFNLFHGLLWTFRTFGGKTQHPICLSSFPH